MTDQIKRAIDISKEHCTEHPLFYLGKIMEELGEFSEAVLVEQGHMPRKVLNEDSFGEAADVINCVCAALVAVWPNMSETEIREKLESELSRKNDKFIAIYDGTYEEKYGGK